MRVLVACEFSGVVRDAFRRRGHDAWSCDLDGGKGIYFWNHYEQCVFTVIDKGWDMMIAHPPCTHLAVSGARHFEWKIQGGYQEKAIEFVRKLWECSIPQICIENPIGILSRKIGPPTQIIQPWQYGHGETKATCLWLKNLPPLIATDIVEGRESRIHRMPPSPTRGKNRSVTYTGIAEAMADQWGQLEEKEYL